MSELSQALRCCRQDEVFCEDVSFSQFLILDTLAEKGKIRLGELHEILSVEKSTTTRLVKPLLGQGMIVREKSNQDLRAANLALTPRGREVHGRVWECFLGFVDGIERGISRNERNSVYKAVRIFVNAMKQTHAANRCDVLRLREIS